MNQDPQHPSGEKELRIRRGRVESVDLYEIKDSELEILERGSPSGLYLNFAIFLFTIAFGAIGSLSTATFADWRIETLFIVIAVIGFIGGIFLLFMWRLTRVSVSGTINNIKSRITPEPSEEPPESPDSAPPSDIPKG